MRKQREFAGSISKRLSSVDQSLNTKSAHRAVFIGGPEGVRPIWVLNFQWERHWCKFNVRLKFEVFVNRVVIYECLNKEHSETLLLLYLQWCVTNISTA
jgi:hypothetical protein